ncbi:alanine--tRNA ligase, mitochondrial [Coccinella septempunctata]|uniref:alanine--tRNA ligase, mitochondrial n=1 Tax=Coccinella septempunctata TaxID=41139 RepID=UPI001D07BE8D|nr:alanine--tRNA ligase, mitochondrial [Coccinella septempunctata]
MIIRTPTTLVQKKFTRSLSKYINPDRSAKAIRQKFLDYFIKDCNHHFVRSSPVVPYCDPSVAFVNAGMNQFKSIFVGHQEPKYKKVANSQKCIRVGGKHNDLNVVGSDGYHHTFFEMLGNWSFGDYFKAEACELAWKLLLDVYKIPSDRLYVTYFKGDEELKIEEDLETKEIWRSIGVSTDRIIPFGMSDNFWEMGEVGPCGPCTEIHYDHLIGSENRSSLINKGLFDLTELWNIVFIEYNRNQDGTISILPKKHVDTGMGFERLTAILQNKTSNYDTDNFDYLIKAVEKICSKIDRYKGMYGEQDWNNLDTSYRILADHSRMVTASLADGIIPEQNQKLRRILRKCFCISTDVFQREGLVKELSNYVVDSLGPVYPEMERNIAYIHQIIDYEEEVYRDLQRSAQSEWGELLKQNENLKFLDVLEAPSLIPAYKDLMKLKPKEINGEIAFKLYDTFGLDRSSIDKLARSLGLPFEEKELQLELEKAKKRSKQKTAIKINTLLYQFQKESVPKTCDTSKYNFSKLKDNYVFEPLHVKVLRIIHHDEIVKKIGPDTFCSLLLDKTNLYSEAGGQVSDRGTIQFEKAVFIVAETENLNSYILHKGFLKCKGTYSLCVDSVGTLSVDEENRMSIMRNHTATHLLNSVLKQLKGATCQKSSKVTEDFLNLDVGIFGPKLTTHDIEEVEYKINSIISKRLEVVTSEINSQKLLEYDDIITVPGEVYPEESLRLVEIKENDEVISREPCCGTHVFNTSDIGNISIIKMKSLGRSTVSLSAVTGLKSKIATENASEISDEVSMLQKTVSENIDKPDVLNIAVASLRNKVIASETLMPIYIKQKCLKDLDDISKRVKNIAKVTLNEFIDMEMQNVLDSKVQTTNSNKQYIIHYLRTSMILENVPLQRATKMCKNIPVMVISYTDNIVQARCCVPKQFCTENFTADKWLKESVVKVFDGYVMNVKGQSEKLVCNMKPKRVNIQDWDFLLKHSMSAAQEFVERYL